MHLAGTCLCGDVAFEIQGDFDSFYLCHCTYCQKDTGSAHASNLFSSAARIVWKAGQDKVQVYRLPATRHVKSFCVNCGSPVPTPDPEGNWLLVPAGCLDQDVPLTPNAHIFVSSRANWDCNLEKIRSFKKFPQ